jgi:hypothetical protein
LYWYYLYYCINNWSSPPQSENRDWMLEANFKSNPAILPWIRCVRPQPPIIRSANCRHTSLQVHASQICAQNMRWVVGCLYSAESNAWHIDSMRPVHITCIIQWHPEHPFLQKIINLQHMPCLLKAWPQHHNQGKN